MLFNKIIVTNYGENSLSIIHKEDLSQVSTINLRTIIPGKTGATRLLVEDNNKILVLDSDNDSLYRVDVSNGRLLDQVNLGRCPIRIKTFENRIYVLNIDSNSLTILDQKDLAIIENIYLGEKPTDLAIDDSSGKAYITNLNGYSISVVDYENGSIEDIKLSYMPFRIKIESGIIYVLGFSNNNTLGHSILSSLDTTKGERIWSKIISGIYFDFIKSKGEEYFYLVDSENSWLYGFDKVKNNKIIYIGGLTNYMNYDLENLYLNDMVNDQMIVVDIHKSQIKKRIAVGKEPHDILLT